MRTKLVKIHELLAFAASAAAFGYGAFHLFRKGTPKYFQLYTNAAGCYMFEELWVIVNALLGNGSQDGLVTVRLFGFFGCLCFMLSANANGLDRLVDEGTNRKAKAFAFIAPVILLLLYALYAFSPVNTRSAASNVIGLLSISPALPAAYLSLKHLLLPEDEMGFLKLTKSMDIAALVFYAANYVYPVTDLYFPKMIMSVYDLILAGMLFGLILLCQEGAEMIRKKILPLIVAVLIFAMLSGCSNSQKTDPKKAEAIRNYVSSVGDDAAEYFTELSKSSCGVTPERVYFGIPETTADEILQASPVPWQEMMTGTPPRLIAELHKKPEVHDAEEDCYTEEEIRAVLTEAVQRGLVMDFCFDSDRETYSIGGDGKITVDTVRGADGGALHEKRDYELKP